MVIQVKERKLTHSLSFYYYAQYTHTQEKHTFKPKSHCTVFLSRRDSSVLELPIESPLIVTGRTKKADFQWHQGIKDSNKVLPMAIIRDWQFQDTAISSGQKYCVHF